MSSPVDLSILQSASGTLHEQFARDAPDVADPHFSPNTQSSSSYTVHTHDARASFQKRRLIGIPEGLFQYYNTVNLNSHMGLLPELERVWISIDHKLFLWDYVNGQDLSSFVEQTEVITDVALVKPKRSLFIDEITHLLVISTPLTVFLLGVSLSPIPNSKRKEIKLFATDLSVSTEVEMVSVTGTDEGRIFMVGSQDGSLYEFHYQERESWFGKRVQLVNHSIGGIQSLLPRFATATIEDRIRSITADRARGQLYALTEKNAILVYKPSGDKSIQHVQSISNLFKSAQDKAPGSPAINPSSFQIISLHPINPSETITNAQLVAVTTNGMRLYFGTSTLPSFYGGSTAWNRPQNLQLIHVRLPPSNLIHPDEQQNLRHGRAPSFTPAPSNATQQARPQAVANVDSSCYIDGLTIAAQPGDTDGMDFLLCMSPDVTAFTHSDQYQPPPAHIRSQTTYGQRPGVVATRPILTETATLLSIAGRTWAMAPVPRDTLGGPDAFPSATNELARQFIEAPPQFIILTNVGLTFLVKRRAIDYVKAVLEDFQSDGNIQTVVEMRDGFGRDQTCAMLLALACGNVFIDSWENANEGVVTINRDIGPVAKQAFYDFGERPVWTERPSYGKSDAQGTTLYSGRREGLALYFARLVRPIWKTRLTSASAQGLQLLSISDKLLVNIQKNLFALSDFLEKNPHLFSSSPSDGLSSGASTSEQAAWKAESMSVKELLTLLKRTIEAVSFVLLLHDHMLPELIARCNPDLQRLAGSLTFEELITTQNGITLSRGLVNVIIDQQIGQQISVDTISDVLQHRCGSFCSPDDVMLYKAKENFRKATETTNVNERQALLAESLRLYTKGARTMDIEKLREVCGDFQELRFAKGAVELPLTCARIFDPINAGLEFWSASMPPNDPRQQFYDLRQRCYDLIIDSLSFFENNGDLSSQSSETNAVQVHAYELAFACDDQMFHSRLYDWLIQRQLTDDLLEIRPPYLESHLRQEPATAEKYQLLWQFYVKDGQPLRAAEVLAALADSTGFPLSLDARLECLTLAVGNAKSHPVSVDGRHETAVAFLTELEEKLEVAQVQLDVYQTLLPHAEDAPEVKERVDNLSQQLLSLTEIYNDYAVPFDLPALKLRCIYVGNLQDDSVVKPIWNQIFASATQGISDPREQADALSANLVPLGQRFYPSESAFPLRFITDFVIRFSLERKDTLPVGWAPRLLVQCGVLYSDVWDVLHDMYESHVPPFNAQANVQKLSSDISILLSDWLQEAKRPNLTTARDEFPVGRIDMALDQYLPELATSSVETRRRYEDIKQQLRLNW